MDWFPVSIFYQRVWSVLGYQILNDLPGTNFAPLTRGADQVLDGPIFSEMRDWAMVREGDWKLVVDRCTGEPSMLINLHDDPYEQHNLGGGKAFDDICEHLQQRLRDWCA